MCFKQLLQEFKSHDLRTLKFKFLVLSLFSALATGCATTYADFEGFISKYPDSRYCALMIEKTTDGRSDLTVKNQRLGSYTQCGNSLVRVTEIGLQKCAERLQTQCMVAYTYDRRSNSYNSNETSNVVNANAERVANRAVELEKYKAKCDSYGYQRGTSNHANCVMKIDEAIEQAKASAKRAESLKNDRDSQCQFVRAAEYARPVLGGFIGSLSRAEEAYSNCMRGTK